MERRAVMERLRERGIQSSVHYPPTHRLSAHYDAGVTLPITESIADRLLTLPLYSTMTRVDVDTVCDELEAALGSCR